MADWLRIYHRLPYPLRALAASSRGYYLRWWRYGPETDRLVEEALERDTWSLKRLQDWQRERLVYVLRRAATKVPYYREYWRQRRLGGDRSSWDYLENWPVLKKEELRQNPTAFVADDCQISHMFHEHTSGSTGKPLDLWWGLATVRSWYALFEARIRRWYGISRHDRWANLGGQLVTPFSQTTPPFWVWNYGLNQLYMSSYHLSPENVPAYLEAMRRHKVVYMWGYASAMHALAQTALERNLKAPKLMVAISNAEPLYEHQRQKISQVFGCPVRETYGMAEIVGDASDCQEHSLHLWPEVGLVEVFQDHHDTAALPGQTGRLIGTGILNADMPLIRYEVGDRGVLAEETLGCACGCNLPMLQKVEGRLDDVIVTPDGRRVGRLDTVFKADLSIREAQVIQESLEKIRLRVVPAPGYDREQGSVIIQRLRDRVGQMEIVLDLLDHIPRSSNGKFRAVISQVKPLTIP